MNNNTIAVVAIALIVGGALGYVFANQTRYDEYGYRASESDEQEEAGAVLPGGMHVMPDGSMMMNDGTGMGMMDHSMMMVQSEKEFITEMVPHHQEAVDTAKEVLARGATTPEMKLLAENIVAAQEKEIADMKLWYLTWYGEPYAPSGNYQPMMRDLEGLSGAAIDKAFLEDMIMHHMGAIMMAKSVTPYIEHAEMKALTEAIVTTQTDEIVTMKRLLAGY